MVTTAIFGVVAAYVLLAILLLSLNISSLWRWWVKAAAILVSTAAFAGSYLAISGLVGWPTTEDMPDRFSLLSSRIIEPDKETGAPGHIYLWIEEIDAEQRVISAPRAFEIPYDDELAAEVDSAQEQLDAGAQIMGEEGPRPNAEAGEPEGVEGEIGDENQQGSLQMGQQGQGTGAPGEAPTDVPSISFSEMPAALLPPKDALARP